MDRIYFSASDWMRRISLRSGTKVLRQGNANECCAVLLPRGTEAQKPDMKFDLDANFLPFGKGITNIYGVSYTYTSNGRIFAVITNTIEITK